jgi:hypothetical protein
MKKSQAKKDKKTLTAPCGLGCFQCDIYEDNLTTDLTQLIHEKLGVPKEEIPCRGCRQQDEHHFHLPKTGCATRSCVKAKRVEVCCDCNDFPCPLLAPTADGASRYPHNMKVYNLCRIKRLGLDKWIEESGEIRKKYFTGKFVVGKGQSD